jgi:peptidoglycan-associated lipoprotein
MKNCLWPVLFALMLSACGSMSGPQATVEDRTAAKSAAAKDAKPADAATAASAAGKGGKGVETAALGAEAVSGGAVDAKPLDGGKGGADPRKDPASPLSKRSIFFDFDSFVVKDEYRPILEAHAAYLMAHRDAKVVLQGNTDERGSREYNLALGQKRAEAVRRALAVLGVAETQLEAVSFGEEKPRSEGSTEAAYADNRRVDIVYTDEQ